MKIGDIVCFQTLRNCAIRELESAPIDSDGRVEFMTDNISSGGHGQYQAKMAAEWIDFHPSGEPSDESEREEWWLEPERWIEDLEPEYERLSKELTEAMKEPKLKFEEMLKEYNFDEWGFQFKSNEFSNDFGLFFWAVRK